MAEATALRNNALGETPIYGQTYTVAFPMLDADGDLVTGASTPDAERSLNGDTFADCTNESTEIATNSGMYYLTLTAAEMTADVVAVIAKSATAGMKTTALVLYPKKLVTIRSGTCNDDGSGTGDVVLDSGASAVDDYYNGMVIAVVIDGAASAEVRMITDYVGSTKTATVTPGFNTAVDNTDTFIIYLPPGMTGLPHIEKTYSDTTQIQSDLSEVDTSDIQSLLTKVYSDTNAINGGEGDISDILSRLTVTNSQLLIVKSDTSDIRSALVIIASDTAHIESDAVRILSDTNALNLGEGDVSDILSRLTVTNSQLLIVKSDTSDIRSALVIIASDTAHIESDAVRILSDTTHIDSGGGSLTSDQDSKLTRVANAIVEVDTSDLMSMLTLIRSDTTAIEAGGGALTATQASQLTRVQSDLINVASDLAEVDTSDIHSLLTLVRSDTTSLASDLAEGDFSDILSRLTVTNSQLLVVKSDTSDIRSALVIIASDTAHIESDAVRVLSDTTLITGSQFTVLEQNTSDTESMLVLIRSDTTAIEAAGGALSSDQDSKLTRVANAIVEVDTSDLMSMLTLIRSDTAHVESDAVRILSDTSLATDARSEPGQGAPAASATPQTKVDWLYAAFRNKHTQTATTYSLLADDEATVITKGTVSDDGVTFTRTELITGA